MDAPPGRQRALVQKQLTQQCALEYALSKVAQVNQRMLKS
jgi:hypothetical protein